MTEKTWFTKGLRLWSPKLAILIPPVIMDGKDLIHEGIETLFDFLVFNIRLDLWRKRPDSRRDWDVISISFFSFTEISETEKTWFTKGLRQSNRIFKSEMMFLSTEKTWFTKGLRRAKNNPPLFFGFCLDGKDLIHEGIETHQIRGEYRRCPGLKTEKTWFTKGLRLYLSMIIYTKPKKGRKRPDSRRD